MVMDWKEQLVSDALWVENTLSALSASDESTKHFDILFESRRYSLMAGGKRIRPALTLAFCRLFGGDPEAALPYACALEMIHTYSLIHDDLPCMDDDDLRRGKPTNHRVYGEAMALLAGDALLTDAFALAAENPKQSGAVNARAVSILSRAAGSRGMVGGQVLDLLGEESEHRPDFDRLLQTHRLKTGALIRAAAALGALAAGVEESDARMRDVLTYADGIGLVFQIVDDILDVTGDAAELGKNIGSDAQENKTTFLSFLTIEEARAYAERLNAEALSALAPYENNEFLIRLAEHLLARRH
jgi:geranylgeranyl diphosphate synthase type II